MLRAVAYARFSSDNQREESIDAQLRAIKKYCSEHEIVLLATYADRGISGTSDNRPEFQRMIADSDKGTFEMVIVHKLDRFARNRYDAAIYKNHLKKRGIRLFSVLENLQDTPESVILESVIEGMNEYYSLNLSREVRKGLLENALACKATGGPPLLGYSVNKETNRYVVNEYEAEAVRMIFTMYVDGHSYSEIIAELNNRGYRTRRGDVFGKNSLYAILKNERYTGVYIYVPDSTKNPTGKYARHGQYDENAVIRIPGGMPAIISEELFLKAQEKLAERQHKSAKFSAKQEYLLSGKVICGVCESPYAGNSRKPRPDHPLYVSYKCTRRNQKVKTCKNPEISRDKLEEMVLEYLSASLFDPRVIPALLAKYNQHIREQSGSAAERVSALKSELQSVERKIRNTVDLMVEIGSPALKQKLFELEESKEKLTFELQQAELAEQQMAVSEDTLRILFRKAQQELRHGTLTNRRKIIDQYVKQVVIFPDRVELVLNFVEGFEWTETIRK
jgi:site-specific DNA recombinase